MLSYINKYHRNYKKEAEMQKKRVESAYSKELSELASNAIERNKLFNKRLCGTISESEEARYKELVARKIELESTLILRGFND